jgi:bile acid-coenzyme A ligase
MDEQLISYAARIAHVGTTTPDAVAITFVPREGDERVVTWAELDQRSTQVAHAMADRGVGAGDRVAVNLRNSPELVQVVCAAWKLGAVPVPVRWDLPAWEHDRVVEVIAPALEVGADDLTWIAASVDGPTDPLPDAISPQTHGICSSGSTGTPKVILIEKPSTWEPDAAPPFPSSWVDVPRPQMILVPAPLYHTNGFATLASMLAGDELVLLEKFDAATVVDVIERHRATTFTATPTMLQRIAALPDIEQRDLSSLQWVLQGAAVISPALVRRWLNLIGAERFYMAYGMTEGLGLTAIRGDEWLTREGSVGRGYRDTEIRILSADGDDLPAGEVGEIYLRAPMNQLYRYLGGAARLPTTADGYGTAGDLGYLDDDGFLFILDRRVDLIVSGGANVYPAEVESALNEHPGIADVVVIGLRDDEWGRRVHAVVQPADPAQPPTADDVIAFAKQHLAAYKVPKSVEVVDVIPRSEATKVSRHELVEARGG